MVLLFFLRPFCSSTILLFSSDQEDNRLFKIEQYNLYLIGARLMPLYESGSRLSVVDDFGIGLIIHLPHSDGTIPLSKQILNITCRKETAVSF